VKIEDIEYRGTSNGGQCVDGVEVCGYLVYDETNGNAFIHTLRFNGPQKRFPRLFEIQVDINNISVYLGKRDIDGNKVYEPLEI